MGLSPANLYGLAVAGMAFSETMNAFTDGPLSDVIGSIRTWFCFGDLMGLLPGAGAFFVPALLIRQTPAVAVSGRVDRRHND